jgi:hypothetical protein
MEWKIFTRKTTAGDRVLIRWYWRKPALEGREESTAGFTSRAQCEADAREHGYTGGGPADEAQAPP